MDYSYTSNAYDYSHFEDRPTQSAAAAAPAREMPAKTVKKKSRVVQISEKQLRRSSQRSAQLVKTMLNLCAVLSVIALIGAVVFSQVQLAELTEEIGSTTQALSEEVNLSVQLEMEAASKMNTDEIETIARERLGMEKVSEGQTTYINLAQEDSGTILQENQQTGFLEELWNSILSIFS